MNQIPPITNPLGKYWEQPKVEDIVINDTHAEMSEKSFKELKEYSSSIPTGVYEGKMWKRREGSDWFLAWFGPSPVKDNCSINWRKITLTDGPVFGNVYRDKNNPEVYWVKYKELFYRYVSTGLWVVMIEGYAMAYEAQYHRIDYCITESRRVYRELLVKTKSRL